MHTMQPERRTRGFTLIEVLIAVIIIGLGMIGISALFAGAARQQQLVSLSSRAATAARNTESKIVNLFTGFRDVSDLAACVSSYNNPAGTPDPSRVPAADRLGTEWVRVNATPDIGPNAAPDNSLSIFFPPSVNGNATNACTWAYFEQPVPEFSMLDTRGDYGSGLSTRLNKDTITSTASADTDIPGFNAFFPVRSVVADTLEIDVYVASDGVSATDPDYPQDSGAVHKYTYIYDPASGGPTNGEGPCNNSLIRLRPQQLHPTATDQGWTLDQWRTFDHIDIEAFKCPVSLDSSNPQVAQITGMQIYGVQETAGPSPPMPPAAPPKTGRYIQRVVVRSCTHRITTLLSLSDRVISETTPAGDIHDVAGVSVMMRGAGTNGALIAVFSYAIQSTREGARFVPVERAGDPEIGRPIRSASVELVYNSDSESYWFFCTKAASTSIADESWLARQGQTLVFAGNNGSGILGADSPSRVVRVVSLDSNRGYWCELERAPRAGNAIVGGTFPRVVAIPFTARSIPGAAGNQLVYGVNALASSRTPPPDNSIESSPQWQLRPIEARVFSISH